MPEPDELEHTLQSKDGDEDSVDDLQDAGHLLRHPVELQGHGQHVQHDDHHDENVELLVRCYIEDNCCNLELQKKKTRLMTLWDSKTPTNFTLLK